LLWVQQNIHSFGGDPDNVTLSGQSAGAFSVIFHVFSPASANLAKKFIIMSGTIETEWFFQKKTDALALYDAFSAYVGCPPSKGDQLVCLQMIIPAALTMSFKEFAKRGSTYRKTFNPFQSSPAWIPSKIPPFVMFAAHGVVIDGTDSGLPDTPLALLEKMDFTGKTFMIGVNTDEGATFVDNISEVIPGMTKKSRYTFSQSDVNEGIDWTFPSPILRNQISSLYRFESHPTKTPYETLSQVLTDAVFTCPTQKLMNSLAGKGANVYAYVFDVKLVLHGNVPHGAELPFLFRNSKFLFYSGCLELQNKPKVKKASIAFSSAAGSIINGTNPGWPKWSANKSYRKFTLQGVQDEDGQHWMRAHCKELWNDVEMDWLSV